MLEEFLQDYTPEASGLSASASDLPADLADCLAELGIRSFRSGLFLTVDPSISDELLNDWRWLVPVDSLVWARSAFGDLFLYQPNEAEPVYFLDTMGGAVQTLGPSVAAVLNTTFLRDDRRGCARKARRPISRRNGTTGAPRAAQTNFLWLL